MHDVLGYVVCMWAWAYLEFVGTLLHIANTFGWWDSGNTTVRRCDADISDADLSGEGTHTETTLSGVVILRGFFVVALAAHRVSLCSSS